MEESWVWAISPRVRRVWKSWGLHIIWSVNYTEVKSSSAFRKARLVEIIGTIARTVLFTVPTELWDHPRTLLPVP